MKPVKSRICKKGWLPRQLCLLSQKGVYNKQYYPGGEDLDCDGMSAESGSPHPAVSSEEGVTHNFAKRACTGYNLLMRPHAASYRTSLNT